MGRGAKIAALEAKYPGKRFVVHRIFDSALRGAATYCVPTLGPNTSCHALSPLWT
jgi:hypothetical protein